MGLNAGDLDREIVLQTMARSQDTGTGEEVLTPVNETLWASWEPLRGSEKFLTEQQLAAHVDGKFCVYDLTTRPSAGTARVVFEGRTYDVQSVIEIGRGDGLELWVSGRSD